MTNSTNSEWFRVPVIFYVKPADFIADGDDAPQPSTTEGADAVVGATLAGLCETPPFTEWGDTIPVQVSELPERLA